MCLQAIMSDFVVSARKYRPLHFEDVVGQKHVTQTLENAISQDQLAQSFLFCGPRGVGKTTCARILARKINGFTEKDASASLHNFNILELDAASNNSVDNIRNLIDQVRFPPQEGKYKVYIIDEVHMLTMQAFNAFLKTLEEPPPYVIFILATTEKHKVLPTILSRCQIFDFHRITFSDIIYQLTSIAKKENISIDEKSLYIIARKSEGSMRDALSIYDMLTSFSGGTSLTGKMVGEMLYVLDKEVYFQLTDYLYERNIAETLVLLNEIVIKGANLLHFVNDLSIHCKDILLARRERSFALLEMDEKSKRMYIDKAASYDEDFLLQALDVLSACEQGYKNAKYSRLWLEINLAKIACRYTAAEGKKKT